MVIFYYRKNLSNIKKDYYDIIGMIINDNITDKNKKSI